MAGNQLHRDALYSRSLTNSPKRVQISSIRFAAARQARVFRTLHTHRDDHVWPQLTLSNIARNRTKVPRRSLRTAEEPAAQDAYCGYWLANVRRS